MRLQFFSDLHLERYPDFTPKAADGVDILVLAGDIGSYQNGSRLTGEDFGLTRFSPLMEGALWPRVVFIPGNHEFDSLDYLQGYARLRQVCETLGIEWLDREVITVNGVRFIGTTLWSDFDALAMSEPTETRRLQAREKAFRAANFYLRKNTALRDGAPMLAQELRELGLDCQAWLKNALSQPHEGKTVVVTHFSPSLRSADPRYGLTPGTAGFCNSLDHLLEGADLWIHGHLHCFNDFVVEGMRGDVPWRCRVVANPLGYANKGEQQAFRENLTVEL